MKGPSTAVVAGQRDARAPAGWIAHPRRKATRYDRTDPGQRQDRRDDARADRLRLRRLFRPVTESKRVRACGTPGTREDNSAVLRITDATGTPAQHTLGATGRVAGFGGLFRCANVWLCMECSARIAAHRAAELEKVLASYVSRGAYAVLVTFTMRHLFKHALALLLAARALGWSRATSGGTWVKHRALTDFAGFCQVLEVTESLENGWHPHVHAVLVFHSEPSPDALAALIDGMWSRWSAGLVKAGLPAPIKEDAQGNPLGLDVQHLDRTAGADRTFESVQAWARYVCKGIAGEAALGPGKEAKGTNRSIKELMRDALIPQVWENATTGKTVETIDLQARAKLHEYERAMHGRKQMNWSQGDYDLRKGADLADEQTDDQVLEQELEGQDVAVIPSESWRRVEPRAAELLAVAERQGAEAACAWLDALGVRWWRPTALTEHLGRRHDPQDHVSRET